MAFARPHDNLKQICLQYCFAYSHQSWQGDDQLLPIKLRESLAMWSYEITWQIKQNLHYHNVYGHQTWQGGDT